MSREYIFQYLRIIIGSISFEVLGVSLGVYPSIFWDDLRRSLRSRATKIIFCERH